MKRLLFSLLLISSPVYAIDTVQVGIFGATQNHNQGLDSQNVGAYVRAGKSHGVELSRTFSTEAIAYSYQAGGFNIGYGAFRQELTDIVDVGGVNMLANDKPTGRIIFVQYTFGNNVFVRLTASKADYTLFNNRRTGPSTFVSGSREVEKKTGWLWLGYRFGL